MGQSHLRPSKCCFFRWMVVGLLRILGRIFRPIQNRVSLAVLFGVGYRRGHILSIQRPEPHHPGRTGIWCHRRGKLLWYTCMGNSSFRPWGTRRALGQPGTNSKCWRSPIPAGCSTRSTFRDLHAAGCRGGWATCGRWNYLECDSVHRGCCCFGSNNSHDPELVALSAYSFRGVG